MVYKNKLILAPGEIVTYLTSVGLLKPALTLCCQFNMPYDIIFEALARQCVLLTEYEDLDAWNWLIENNLHELPTLGNSPSSVAWLMLKTYLEEYEEKNMSILHKIVCQKIIRMGGYIPYWLLASYKVNDFNFNNDVMFVNSCRNATLRNCSVFIYSMDV